jgi:hypothetical protein
MAGPVNCEKIFGSGSTRRVGGHFLFPNRTLVGFGLSERVAQRAESSVLLVLPYRPVS